jgi:hypothetical protein
MLGLKGKGQEARSVQMNRLMGSVVLTGALVMGMTACQSNGEHAQGEENCTPATGPNEVGKNAVNTNCPMTGELADQSVVAECQGTKIAFCCTGCKSKFEKMSEADKAKILTKATTYPGRSAQ